MNDSLMKSRPREKEKKKGPAKTPSLLGTSRTVGTRALLGGMHRLGVTPTTLGPIGMSGEAWFTFPAA